MKRKEQHKLGGFVAVNRGEITDSFAKMRLKNIEHSAAFCQENILISRIRQKH